MKIDLGSIRVFIINIIQFKSQRSVSFCCCLAFISSKDALKFQVYITKLCYFLIILSLYLIQPSLVERLVVVDISPSPTSAHSSFCAYIQAMKEVKIASNIPRSTARRLAEDQLRKIVKVTVFTFYQLMFLLFVEFLLQSQNKSPTFMLFAGAFSASVPPY